MIVRAIRCVRGFSAFSARDVLWVGSLWARVGHEYHIPIDTRNFPNSAGELGGSTNPPRSTRRALTAESEIAKLISYLHVAGQDQCRCNRLFSTVVTGAGTTRKWRQRLAYTRFGGKAEIKTAR